MRNAECGSRSINSAIRKFAVVGTKPARGGVNNPESGAIKEGDRLLPRHRIRQKIRAYDAIPDQVPTPLGSPRSLVQNYLFAVSLWIS
jgi:hypothetical protein